MELIPDLEAEYMIMVNSEFVGLYLHDAQHRIARYDLAGESIGAIDLPTLGSVPSALNEYELTGKRNHDELFFSFWSLSRSRLVSARVI